MDEYPDEIRYRPTPLVALLGAQDLYSAIEKGIPLKKDQNNTREVPSIRLLSLDLKDGLPQPKDPNTRKNSHEYTRQPDGLLKANWMHRVVHRYPAVAAIFLDWDAPDWKTREPEIFTIIDNLRNNNIRQTQLLLVLLRKDAYVDEREERFQLFKKRTSFDSKHITTFVKDDQLTSIQRFESLALKLAYEHYDFMAKAIKKNKESFSKSLHQKMFARHHFKVGYYCELAQDLRSAVKYYISAYTFLRDAKKATLEFMEVKVFADYINFRICYLQMQQGTLSEAVSQFTKHMQYYKSLIELDKEYLHYAWVSRQYRVFGELLDLFYQYQQQPRQRGMTHPGFYYQAAANSTLERKKAALLLCEPSREKSEIAELMSKVRPFRPAAIDQTQQVYVGQKLDWLAVDQAYIQAHPLEMNGKDPDQTSAPLNWIIAQELSYHHYSVAIELLLRALSSFGADARKQPDRTALALTAQIGHLHFLNNSIPRAIDYLTLAAKSYRAEKWWELLTDVLADLLECSKRSGNMADIVQHSLELISKHMKSPVEVKKAIQLNLLDMIKLNAASITQPIVVSMSHMDPLIMCQVQFEQDTACVHAEVNFRVVLHNDFPAPIQFSKLAVNFTNPSYNQSLADSSPELAENADKSSLQAASAKPNSLLFLPQSKKQYNFGFIVKDQARVQCESVVLELGSSAVHFKWDVSKFPTKREKKDVQHSNSFIHRSTIEILEHEAFLDMQVIHEEPALVKEFYPIQIRLTNNHENITSGKLILTNLADHKDRCFFVKSKDDESDKIPVDEINIEPISHGSSETIAVYFYPKIFEDRSIKIQVQYETDTYSTGLERIIPIPVRQPFAASFELCSADFSSVPITAPTAKVALGEKFYLRVDVLSVVPFMTELLRIDRVSIDGTSSGSLVETGSSYAPDSRPVQLLKDDKYTVWFTLTATQASSTGTVDLGSLLIDWRRQSSIDAAPQKASTRVDIPAISVEQLPFTATYHHDERGVVGETIKHTLSVFNNTDFIQEFILEVRENKEECMVSGDKRVIFKVLPQDCTKVIHLLLALRTGRITLPRFAVRLTKSVKDYPKVFENRMMFIEPEKTTEIVL